jgi:hypothetical protein
MENTERTFVEKLIVSIVENKDIPKVQVERALSPILEIFIESVMNELANKGVIWKGEYELIAPEFPLDNGEKDNARSTNIDFLLFNKSERSLVFVELKTDSRSFDTKQYKLYKKCIENKRGEDLYAFLNKLGHEKYKKYKKKIDEKLKEIQLDGLEQVSEIKIVYLAPKKLTEENKHRGKAGREAIENLTKKNGDLEKFVTFEDLENNNIIKHEFKEEWKIITKHIQELNNN